jgi:GH25 family lysozyme M1 (1,4-beta-N-acetylmuramidase)
VILGLDISGHQPGVNFAAVKASGRGFVVLKATEGVGWTDPSFAAYRKAAHAAGLIVGLYHFARADTGNSAAAEAQSFLSSVGTLQTGEFLVLDQEVPNTVAWCQQWLDKVYAATGVRPFIYMNQGNGTGVTSGNWTTVAKNYGLWLARYDNTPAAQTSVPYWGVCTMKQYSDAGSVPGVAGTCDVNAFYGSTAQLLAYGKGGTPAPTPAPRIVQGDDMRVLRDPNGTIWLATETSLEAISDETLSIVAQKVWGGIVDCTAAEMQALAADTTARRNAMLTDVQRWVLCAVPSDRDGAWLWDRVGNIETGVQGTTAPQLNEAKLAAALLSDPASVDRLGAAIAAHLKLASS